MLVLGASGTVAELVRKLVMLVLGGDIRNGCGTGKKGN